MFLTRITLNNFKNISGTSLAFSPKINCISGSNGAGKTNLLDAIYYLSMTKSYFSSSDRYVAAYDCDEMTLCGVYSMDGGVEERISASIYKGGEKVIRRGAKQYARFSEHIGLIPVVMVSPTDGSLINDSGEERRKYMNFILSQTDREYLRHVQAYGQLLAQRNKLLKDDHTNQLLLDTISERMNPHATYIYKARRDLCVKLLPMLQQFYSRLSGCSEQVSIAYRSDLEIMPLDELLLRESAKEKALRYTTVGVQRDDMEFSLDGHPIRQCGSQGQQKSFLLSMKLAQFLFIKEIYRQTPILLLDDVFDKLDMSRVESLLELVSSLDFGQIFITDCNTARLGEIAAKFDAPCRNFKVENGVISEID